MSFDTNQPSLVQGLAGYTTDPLFTVGETIGNYTPVGILDGIGAIELNGTTVRFYVNHELGPTVGYAYSLENGTQLKGGRVSYFDVDKRTLSIVDAGLAYDTIVNRAGQVVASSSVYSPSNPSGLDSATGLNRLCSASLFEPNQFGSGRGLVDPIFFTGEESAGTNYALDIQTNTLYALPAFGRAGYENVAEVDTGTTDKVAFVIGDDTGFSPLYMYVGNKNAKGDGSFLDRNGLASGKVYAWVADDPTNPNDPIELSAETFKGTNNSTNGRFVEIAYYDPAQAGTNGYDNLGYATTTKQDDLAAAVNAFQLARPEDVSTNPADGTQFAVNATGTGNFDKWGTVYRFDIDFQNIAAGNITAKVDILFDGNEANKQDFGLRSPDNLDWADDGKIYLQEDRSIDAFGTISGEEASLYSLNPSVSDPSATLTRIAQVDRSALPAGQTDPVPNDIGNWETSGILDVSTLFGNNPGDLIVFDVQAHSLKDGAISSQNLVEGGQLLFLVGPEATLVQDSALVVGSNVADTKLGGIDFDGVNDLVFTGAGNDEVDVPLAGALSGFNRISVGSGKDTVFAADDDRVFGDAGDDLLDATDASGYRLSGGAGNDDLFLGVNGRALGGDGNDRFFVQSGGGNILSGGAGSDQFWMLTDSLPSSPNTIADFTPGTDVIGIANQGAGVDFADLSFSGNNIALNGVTFATLTGIQTNTLTAANFVFASL
ncbi:alkaline phosphatase PhoX [Synechocystis sp. LKSZ1]|uniref:alkaline phosphatase PhoX n=1 Tax=Synechocystis sp. LKSZ1 TaxID=3144951 RepID=UPI00336C1DBE